MPDTVIEAYVEKIVASKDGFEWYLRFDGDPNDPIHCKVNGKRRQSATYTVAGKEFPAAPKGNTGSSERLKKIKFAVSRHNQKLCQRHRQLSK